MHKLSRQVYQCFDYPEKVLQFGEGNFLRAFVDWMIHRLNEAGHFQGSVVVVQPIVQGTVDLLNEQEGLYTLLLRGLQGGQVVSHKEVITSIKRGINPYQDWEGFLATAEIPSIRYIVSNTTEAGISYQKEPLLPSQALNSFPGKLTAWLYRRFSFFKGERASGTVILPCELIDRNGDTLKKVVLQLAQDWHLGQEFITWLEEANYFLNTLVDRIVTGYPRDTAQEIMNELGYEDRLLDTGELFHLWVIEGPEELKEELPFAKLGLEVLWVKDVTPYRHRKVYILNGAHTMSVLAAYLAGKETVKEMMEDQVFRAYLEQGLFREIIPNLTLPRLESEKFALDVLERFQNPFIKHYLLDISMNSTAKYKARVLPSLLGYIQREGALPSLLTFSLAALLAFYEGREWSDDKLWGYRGEEKYRIFDDRAVLDFFFTLWQEKGHDLVALTEEALARESLWGQNLNKIPGLTAQVASQLSNIKEKGTREALQMICEVEK